MKLRVLVADDHQLIRACVSMLLLQKEVASIVTEASSPEEVLRALAQTPPDVLVTDFSMPSERAVDGLGLLRRIRREYPDLPIIVLTMIANTGVLTSILDLRVRGLVDKADSMDEVCRAIEAISLGRDYVSTTFRRRLDEIRSGSAPQTTAKLSPREGEVLRLFASGLTVSEIARRTSRSIKTVSRQKSDAMAKLGLKTDLEIYAFARENHFSS